MSAGDLSAPLGCAHVLQEVSKGKAACVTERVHAEEELGRVRSQLRLQEVRLLQD